jgi:hypothetical protein
MRVLAEVVAAIAAGCLHAYFTSAIHGSSCSVLLELCDVIIWVLNMM